MNKSSSILAELRGDAEYTTQVRKFLDDARRRPNVAPCWLDGDFWASQWTARFGKNQTIWIDWDISLDDGTSLLDDNPASAALRTLICAQTHPLQTGTNIISSSTAYQRVQQAVRLADYFLLHYSHSELLAHGFAALSEGDFECILTTLASGPDTENTIYEWPERMSRFVRELSAETLTSIEVERYKRRFKSIGVVDTPPEERLLPNLTDQQIVQARVALLKAGLYRKPKGKGDNAHFAPDGVKLRNILYPNILGSRAKKSIVSELCWGPPREYRRELPAVFTRHGEANERITERLLLSYARRLKAISSMSEMGLSPPIQTFAALSKKSVLEALRAAPPGRFVSVPSEHIFFALRAALDFLTDHADHLLASFERVAAALKASGCRPAHFSRGDAFLSCLEAKTKEFGIKAYSIRNFTFRNEAGKIQKPTPNETYYKLLRNNYGLLEAVQAVYGATALALGVLSARRRSEVARLRLNGYLDETETMLRFEAAKTGAMDERQTIERPIPPVIVKSLKRLQIFQENLVRSRAYYRTTNLFSYPRYGNWKQADSDSIEIAIDCFLDYVEMPVDEHGHRYYIRFHQARRFFPQAFMESGLPGGRDLLSWFLGHTDSEQVWQYILEMCSGDAIEKAAAQTATAQIRAGNEAFDDLSGYLKEVFGVRDFWALSEDELNGYILKLEQLGDVRVEIEYFDTTDGMRHRMLMKVMEPSHA
jgi:integrase